ncbi:hypothetical protein BHE74_00002370 [Ensete ventricosum]|uniref:Uncharacterized protein n=1 Tax=Ensete ventricosum TaxID=4639 RepID=A0A444GEG4_ENSVE|nr:hypothetical protein B296_00016926 [Ensete ventricosum]RWW33211.1 hypothetical protein GW17_00002094 [Ensete ventricosum]RWW88744.1 hypothetical protein BHE74_00002370 [Ensete ventricosum]RZR75816.1 hypothetical protein BHM03_00000303 [Ensete ventricosum]
MGGCHGKPIQIPESQEEGEPVPNAEEPTTVPGTPRQPKFPFCSPSPLPGHYKNSPANSSVTSTPLRFLKRPFPPPSPAKHIKALLARRHGSVKPNEAPIPEGSEVEVGLDKNFGFSKQLFSKFELGEEIGRGHFGYTCTAKVKKGDMKGEEVAVKNFLFTSEGEKSTLKAIDFGLSDFVKPGIFRAVLKAEPTFDEAPWPSLSSQAKDFVKKLLNKDYRKRMTAAQALCKFITLV